MEQLSKAQKQYFLILMSGLDRANQLNTGPLVAVRTATSLTLYAYGQRAGDPPQEPALMSLSQPVDIDRFDNIAHKYFVKGVDGVATGQVIYRPTPAARDLYQELLDEGILAGVKAFWQDHPDDGPGLVSICCTDVGSWHISVSEGAFLNSVRELKQQGRVAEPPHTMQTKTGCARLYLPDDPNAKTVEGDTPTTLRNQYNTGRDSISGNERVEIHYHNGDGSKPKLRRWILQV